MGSTEGFASAALANPSVEPIPTQGRHGDKSGVTYSWVGLSQRDGRELGGMQATVDALGRDQFLVSTLLGDAGFIDHDDPVSILIVASRCAITRRGRPLASLASEAWMARSVSESSAEVASSRIRIG